MVDSSSGLATCVVHVYGLPWALDARRVSEVLTPLLPARCSLLEPPILPLDKKARNTGRALLHVELSQEVDGDGATTRTTIEDVVHSLHGQRVTDGDSSSSGSEPSSSCEFTADATKTNTAAAAAPVTRYLEARPSTAAELDAQRRHVAKVAAKAEVRAPQAFCKPTEAHEFLMPTDGRDLIVLCHETRAEVGTGTFDLNNLIQGRVDVLARCVSAALFVSHGVRRTTRVWLLLQDVGITLCVDGALVKGLHPDERTIASAVRRALRAASAEEWPVGWRVIRGDLLEARLAALLGGTAGGGGGNDTAANGGGGGDEKRRLLVLHELGVQLAPEALSSSSPSSSAVSEMGTVLVVGDHQGFSVSDEDCFERFGGVRVSVGPVPLLASHCIVLAHATLDCAFSNERAFRLG